MSQNDELKRLAEIMVRDVNGDLSDAEARNFHQHLSDYEAATTPEKILVLIAENERLRVDLKSVVRLNNENADLFKAKNDQLKAENERLEVEVKRMTSIAYAAHGAFRMETMAERDQLRAEVAGLKTGYETYERVNAELKAEVEGLRKGAGRYEWLREARSGYIEVVEWIGPHATGMTGEDLDSLLDAAMGKGEQS